MRVTDASEPVSQDKPQHANPLTSKLRIRFQAAELGNFEELVQQYLSDLVANGAMSIANHGPHVVQDDLPDARRYESVISKAMRGSPAVERVTLDGQRRAQPTPATASKVDD